MCHKLSVIDFLALSLFAAEYGDSQLSRNDISPTHSRLKTMVNQTLKPQQTRRSDRSIGLKLQ